VAGGRPAAAPGAKPPRRSRTACRTGSRARLRATRRPPAPVPGRGPVRASAIGASRRARGGGQGDRPHGLHRRNAGAPMGSIKIGFRLTAARAGFAPNDVIPTLRSGDGGG
jgi:hypothetical protein